MRPLTDLSLIELKILELTLMGIRECKKPPVLRNSPPFLYGILHTLNVCKVLMTKEEREELLINVQKQIDTYE